jgi:hypothetical protein
VLAFSLNRIVSRSPIEFSARFSAHLAQAAFHRRRDAKRDAHASALLICDRGATKLLAPPLRTSQAARHPSLSLDRFPGLTRFECRSALMLLSTCMVGDPDFLVFDRETDACRGNFNICCKKHSKQVSKQVIKQVSTQQSGSR